MAGVQWHQPGYCHDHLLVHGEGRGKKEEREGEDYELSVILPLYYIIFLSHNFRNVGILVVMSHMYPRLCWWQELSSPIATTMIAS